MGARCSDYLLSISPTSEALEAPKATEAPQAPQAHKASEAHLQKFPN